MRRLKALVDRQAAMKAAGGHTPATTSMPVLFAKQIESAVLATLKNIDGLQPLVQTSLAQAMPLALGRMQEIVVSPDSTPEHLIQVSSTLCWLFSVCLKFDNKSKQLEARTQEAGARKARAQAARESVVLKVAKERKRLQRVIDSI